jgi:polyhydroxybutyrate depolymerase
MFRRLLPLLLLLAFAAAPARAGVSELTFKFEGLTRQASFYVPEGLTGPAPLILAVHGVFETGHGMRRVSQKRLETLADRYGYVIAYPWAYQMVWDVGAGLGESQIWPPRDDLSYLNKVIDEAKARAEIDPRRIFAVGFSQGGLMSFELACTQPGLLRAIGVVGMELPEALIDDCATALPAGVFIAHGTADPIVPFLGGNIPSGPFDEMAILSFDKTLAYLTAHKGCGAPSGEWTYDSREDGTSVERQLWLGCRVGAVEAYRIHGGGHRWPGDAPYSPVGLAIGPATQEIDGAAAAFSFFSRFR